MELTPPSTSPHSAPQQVEQLSLCHSASSESASLWRPGNQWSQTAAPGDHTGGCDLTLPGSSLATNTFEERRSLTNKAESMRETKRSTVDPKRHFLSSSLCKCSYSACFLQQVPEDVTLQDWFSYHDLFVRLCDISVVGPRGLGVSIPDHFRCAVVLLQERIRSCFISYFIWKEKDKKSSTGECRGMRLPPFGISFVQCAEPPDLCSEKENSEGPACLSHPLC